MFSLFLDLQREKIFLFLNKKTVFSLQIGIVEDIFSTTRKANDEQIELVKKI